jgi:hypothetical protein
MIKRTRPRPRAQAAPRLAELQRLLTRLITAPEGVAQGLDAERAPIRGGLESIVASDVRLSAEQHLDIYANAYFYRLLDVLRENFPATATVAGADAFHNLITSYLVEHPPSEPSIVHCGQHLADYLRGYPLARGMPWLADLAAVEQAKLDVLHAPDAEVLGAAAMSAIPPSQWPKLQMRTQPAVKILSTSHDVAKVLSAIDDGRKWRRPPEGDFAILVWRHNDRVFHRSLDNVERAALKAVSTGARFERICTIIADQVGEERAPKKITTLLNRWLSDGILAGKRSPRA